MTELRWVLSREQVKGAFSEPLSLADGSEAYARLQYREVREGLVERSGEWVDIPVVSEILDAPKLQVVKGAH